MLGVVPTKNIDGRAAIYILWYFHMGLAHDDKLRYVRLCEYFLGLCKLITFCSSDPSAVGTLLH